MSLYNEVGEDCYFYLADGKVLKSISELIQELKTMEQWVFDYHVNSEKNDFVSWIEHLTKR